ncbi:YqzE family protein [Cytobacillus gottheilii]|uniref:YqzE family protein n=1 Tax=Cytobacillus gottheilii TaxID=859144 RepID=A0ABX8F976_9BACI|nr:YqzE family protein [Cytobacillus gottheilii]QVY60323.1 YqzE family protein [Cytobacillus gottheilii]
MKSNDYVKFMTETFVKYMDQPKDERKKNRQQKKVEKEPFLFRWFGVIPYVFYYGLKTKRKN